MRKHTWDNVPVTVNRILFSVQYLGDLVINVQQELGISALSPVFLDDSFPCKSRSCKFAFIA